jgi:predicted amidophosphoribosyltransferase
MPFCTKCGLKILENYTFCPRCGHQQPHITDQPRIAPQSQTGQKQESAQSQQSQAAAFTGQSLAHMANQPQIVPQSQNTVQKQESVKIEQSQVASTGKLKKRKVLKCRVCKNELGNEDIRCSYCGHPILDDAKKSDNLTIKLFNWAKYISFILSILYVIYLIYTNQ